LLNQVASVKDTVIPSKLLTYMAAGRPVLAAVNSASQGAEIIRDANGGLLVAPEDPLALAAGVQVLADAGPATLEGMSLRNRQYAERYLTSEPSLPNTKRSCSSGWRSCAFRPQRISRSAAARHRADHCQSRRQPGSRHVFIAWRF